MRAQYPGEFLGVSRLVDDDVAHRPRLTPGTGVRATALHGVDEWLPLWESVVVDL
jgi:hypothetical protein